jgi:hypothetical protein
LKFQAQQVKTKMANPDVPDLADDIKIALGKGFGDWNAIKSEHTAYPFIFVGEPDGNKRYNPMILPIQATAKHIDMKFVAGLALMHKLDTNRSLVKILKPALDAGGGPGDPMQPMIPPVKGPKNPGGVMPGGPGAAVALEHPYQKMGVPTRMVVVQAVFPMKQQVIEYQRAFKLSDQSELFAKQEDLPKPVGLNIVRFEIAADGKSLVNKDGEVIVSWDGKKLTKSPKLDALLIDAIYDDETPKSLESWVWNGLTMPMPIVKNVPYPRFNFDGFEVVWEEDPNNANIGGGVKPPAMPPQKGSGPGKPAGDPPATSGGLPMGSKGKRPTTPMMPPDGGGDPMNMGAPVSAPDGVPDNVKAKELVKIDKELHDRLFKKPSDYNIFHILGQHPPKELPANLNGGGPGDRPGIMPPGGMVGQKAEGLYFSAWHIDPPNAGGGFGPMTPGGIIPPGGPGRGNPPMPMQPKGREPKGPGDPMGPEGGVPVHENWERDALVRFIDPDVQPGKTYYYAVQVRMANPNYQKSKDVAFAALAKPVELLSPWATTPTITIPGEYHLYALDQKTLDDWAKPPQDKDKKKKDTFDTKVHRERTTFQIHQWVPDRQVFELRETAILGDWIVAERISVARGEQIGVNVLVQAPVWKELKNAFDLVYYVEKEKVKGKTVVKDYKVGMRIDMKKEIIDPKTRKPVDEGYPVLIDFVGGKRAKPNSNELDEESAVEALILMPDGRLRVHNSRADTDPPRPNEDAKDERKVRVEHARQRIEELTNPAPAAETGPGMPPMGGQPPRPKGP